MNNYYGEEIEELWRENSHPASVINSLVRPSVNKPRGNIVSDSLAFFDFKFIYEHQLPTHVN